MITTEDFKELGFENETNLAAFSGLLFRYKTASTNLLFMRKMSETEWSLLDGTLDYDATPLWRGDDLQTRVGIINLLIKFGGNLEREKEMTLGDYDFTRLTRMSIKELYEIDVRSLSDKERLVRALLLSYAERSYVFNLNWQISHNEARDVEFNEICNILGDKEYLRWAETI